MDKFSDIAVALLLAVTLPAFAATSEPDVMSKLFDAQLALAKNGDINAYYHIGEMYEKGLGTPQNLDEARSWYAKAADNGQGLARDKLAKWKKIEEDRTKASERSAARERQVEETRLMNESRERAAREAAEDRVRLAAQAKAKAAQDAARIQAIQQAKAAAEAKARVELEARHQAEATTLARAEAAKKAAVESRPVEQKNTEGAATGTNGSSDAKAESSAKTPGTPIQAIISRQTENNSKYNAADPATDHGPDSLSSDDKRFSSNPCNAPTAKFLSTCR